MVLTERFLGNHRLSLAVTEVAGRRADDLRDFVAVLKLDAIDLNDSLGLAKERLSQGLN